MNHLYVVATGALVSSTSLAINPVPAGMAVKVSSSTGAWNTSTLDFDEFTGNGYIDKSVFYKRITCSVLQDIKTAAKTNIAIETLLDYIAGFQSINLDDDEVIDGLEYLVDQSVITDAKRLEVLNG